MAFSKCEICNKSIKHLDKHIRYTHSINIPEYRNLYPNSFPLVGRSEYGINRIDCKDILLPNEILDIIKKHPISFAVKIKTFYRNTYNHINENFKGIRLMEKIYRYCYGNGKAKCKNPECNNESKFDAWNSGFYKYCSKKCMINSKSRVIDIQNTKILRYGTIKYNNDSKRRKTNIKLYGEENPCFIEKSFNARHLYKEYKLPSGRIVKLQGYEPQAMNILLNNYHENEIICGKLSVPVISYYDINKLRKFYPDFYIPKEKLIIEVKSTYTYNKDKNNIDNKINGCKLLGYNIHIWILEKKGNILNIIK